MIGEHDPDQNPALDEIESMAAVAARFWLSEAEQAVCDQRIAPSCEAAAMQGFMLAAAINYAAERQMDAAQVIAEALKKSTEAIKYATAILDTMAPPRFKGKPSRFEG